MELGALYAFYALASVFQVVLSYLVLRKEGWRRPVRTTMAALFLLNAVVGFLVVVQSFGEGLTPTGWEVWIRVFDVPTNFLLLALPWFLWREASPDVSTWRRSDGWIMAAVALGATANILVAALSPSTYEDPSYHLWFQQLSIYLAYSAILAVCIHHLFRTGSRFHTFLAVGLAARPVQFGFTSGPEFLDPSRYAGLNVWEGLATSSHLLLFATSLAVIGFLLVGVAKSGPGDRRESLAFALVALLAMAMVGLFVGRMDPGPSQSAMQLASLLALRSGFVGAAYEVRLTLRTISIIAVAFVLWILAKVGLGSVFGIGIMEISSVDLVALAFVAVLLWPAYFGIRQLEVRLDTKVPPVAEPVEPASPPPPKEAQALMFLECLVRAKENGQASLTSKEICDLVGCLPANLTRLHDSALRMLNPTGDSVEVIEKSQQFGKGRPMNRYQLTDEGLRRAQKLRGPEGMGE